MIEGMLLRLNAYYTLQQFCTENIVNVSQTTSVVRPGHTGSGHHWTIKIVVPAQFSISLSSSALKYTFNNEVFGNKMKTRTTNVLRNAGCARSRYTLKLSLNFFNQLINQ